MTSETGKSRVAVTIALSSLAAGLVGGLIYYLNRSPVRQAQVAGTDAWIPHLVLTGVLLTGLGVIASRQRWDLLTAPLGRRATARFAATFRRGRSRPVRWPRLLVVALLAFVQAWLLFRAAFQVFAGFDPNFPVNAWGGPSYLGAMFCHYVDIALLEAVAAGLQYRLVDQPA
ncbi:hypothetical protein [Cryptosporangium arvum]|uniref:hypothetical protein n=1 Tax=Cryptosporangium arvum TaxID=80871 RepID=UPI001B80E39E|nr:hypothetical protein [Cryptosporangium arvum]